MSLILDCEGCYTRGTLGVVQGLVSAEYEVVASAYGAYGDAGRIGTWYETIVKAKDGDVFRVIKSGGSSKMGPSTVYLVKGKTVLDCKLPFVEEMFESVGKDLPFELKDDKIDPAEWVNLQLDF